MRAIQWLESWEAAVGKTVERVVTDGKTYVGTVVVLFTDGTALSVTLEHGYEAGDTGIAIEEPMSDRYSDYFDEDMQIDLGLMTAAEFAAKEQAKREAAARDLADAERAQYERLRAKFG